MTNRLHTLYGSLTARHQDERWYVAQDFSRVPSAYDADIKAVMQRYASVHRDAALKLLATAHSVDIARRRCVFVLPRIPTLSPVSSHIVPLPPPAVYGIVLEVAKSLASLHAAGFGAWLLGPESVFCNADFTHIVLVPTPWLSVVPWPRNEVYGSTQALPRVATPPEFLDSAETRPVVGFVQADIYCLGTITWTLLTGLSQRNPHQLPSELSPELAGWDRFIDGCCRTSPQRRFTTLAAAMSEVPSVPSGIPAVVESPRVTKVTSRRTALRTSSVVYMAVSLLLCAMFVLWGLSGWLTELPRIRSYTRGFADTVISYRNRSYKGAAWRKIQSAKAVQTIIAGSNEQFGLSFQGIIGWDSNNYWVLSNRGNYGACFCSITDGHWKSRAETDVTMNSNVIYTMWEPRLMAPQDCIWVNRSKIVRVNSKGATTLIDEDLGGGLLCPVAKDLFFVFTPSTVYQVSRDQVKEINVYKHKEAFVHGEDNTPLRDYPVHEVRFAASFREGHAIGLSVPFSDDPEDEPFVVAEYRNGLWYQGPAIQTIVNYYGVKHAWFGGSVSKGPRFVVVVGGEGRVVFHPFGGRSVVQNIRAEHASTDLTLMRVWGVDESLYWVMDRSGTIWQRENDEWIVVVRGMWENDVRFEAAWISPEGVVIAATEQDIYRLE